VATITPTDTKPMRADAVRNRARVLGAARECMARNGLDVQMEEIARKAGVGVGTVYRHFPNKDELIEALAADRFVRLAELADEALENPDPWDAFVHFMRASAVIQVTPGAPRIGKAGDAIAVPFQANVRLVLPSASIVQARLPCWSLARTSTAKPVVATTGAPMLTTTS
jgi:AcrR family transcriptional regulator